MNRLYILGRSLFLKLADLVTLGKGRNIRFHQVKIRLPFSFSRYYPPDYEKSNFDFISQLDLRNAHCLDIGAHIGIYSIWMAKSKGCLVTAFEPTPAIHKKLLKMVALNRLEDKITCRKAAIAGHTGNARFHIHYPKQPGLEVIRFAEANSLENYNHGPASITKIIGVECFTIDTYREKEELQIGFIKLDAEGSEMSILRGAHYTFRHDRPSGIISLHCFMYKDRIAGLGEIFDFLISHQMTVYFNGVPVDKPGIQELGRRDIFDIHFAPAPGS